MSSTPTLGHVLLPVANIDAALDFYERALGLTLRFRDGDRYAALAAGNGTIALATRDEQPVAGAMAVGIKVSDLDAAAEQARAAGARIVGDMIETAHEQRLVVADHDANIFVLYASKLKPAS